MIKDLMVNFALITLVLAIIVGLTIWVVYGIISNSILLAGSGVFTIIFALSWLFTWADH